MIIRFPTGLYRSILPKGTQAGSVTYIISNQNPPKTEVRAIQIPTFERRKPLPQSLYTPGERRGGFGELIYTLAKANRSKPGSNIKQFEVGEIIEFTDDPIEEVLFTNAPDSIEIQHNTNILDLDSIGLSPVEIDQLIAESERRKDELEKEFTSLKSELETFNADISENQKKINESNKTIKAVRSIYNIPVEAERSQLISNRNTKSTEVEEAYNKLISVSQLVR